MLTVSLHGIKLHAKIGLYPEEKITGNDFEIDVDVFVNTQGSTEFPFIDYTIIRQIVAEVFQQPGELLETFVALIHGRLKEKFLQAESIKVAVRKLNPPIEGEINYAQVCYDN